MNLYVKNINHKIADHELAKLFSSFGIVVSARIVRDDFSGIGKGFGFVEMANTKAALQAIDELHETTFGNRYISVSVANYEQQG